MAYDNNMKGVLFKNTEKQTESYPDYKGNAEVDGVEYWLSAWINTSQKDGSKYMKLAFQAKDERGNDRPQQNTPQRDHAPSGDDDIPF
jgi:hypothetical protein